MHRDAEDAVQGCSGVVPVVVSTLACRSLYKQESLKMEEGKWKDCQ